MAKQNIRKPALEWFNSKYQVDGEIFSSKFYTEQESWSNSKVWFFQLPMGVVNSNPPVKIHLICENHLEGDSFIYFKVSSFFFLKNLKSFDVDEKENVIRMYLSAEAVDMFTEIRGKGKVDFKAFRVV